MSFLILVVKGFIIGIAKVIPGVSGAVLMISLGLYEKCLQAITHFWKNIKENFHLLFGIGLGVMLAIVLGSKIIAFLLNHFKLPIILLFVGLIIGGLPSFTKEVQKYPLQLKSLLVFILCFSLVLFLSVFKFDLSIINSENSIGIIFLFIGIIDAATMIIPGISGTAILMVLGLYETSIQLFASITSITSVIQNFNSFMPYGIGLGFGILLVSFLMNFLLHHYKGMTYYGILGFQYSAILTILLEILNVGYNISQLSIGLIFLTIGIWATRYLEKWS